MKSGDETSEGSRGRLYNLVLLTGRLGEWNQQFQGTSEISFHKEHNYRNQAL